MKNCPKAFRFVAQLYLPLFAKGTGKNVMISVRLTNGTR